ncbi:MAG: DUF2935 domain-containing protein [Sphingomicrobium sp.]
MDRPSAARSRPSLPKSLRKSAPLSNTKRGSAKLKQKADCAAWWPLFFDHARHEAERWTARLETLAGGESEFDRSEVTTFWTNIMDEHARFVGHLLDPDETELIETCAKTSNVFQQLHKGGLGGVASALVSEPGTVVDSLIQNPQTDAVLSAAKTILDFKTKAVRDIEAGRIKSIIDPRLADHVRREALKFINELRRSV